MGTTDGEVRVATGGPRSTSVAQAESSASSSGRIVYRTGRYRWYSIAFDQAKRAIMVPASSSGSTPALIDAIPRHQEQNHGTTPAQGGLSARIYHPPKAPPNLQSKSLQYLGQSVAHWVMSRETMVFMVPAVCGDGS